MSKWTAWERTGWRGGDIHDPCPNVLYLLFVRNWSYSSTSPFCCLYRIVQCSDRVNDKLLLVFFFHTLRLYHTLRDTVSSTSFPSPFYLTNVLTSTWDPYTPFPGVLRPYTTFTVEDTLSFKPELKKFFFIYPFLFPSYFSYVTCGKFYTCMWLMGDKCFFLYKWLYR